MHLLKLQVGCTKTMIYLLTHVHDDRNGTINQHFKEFILLHDKYK